MKQILLISCLFLCNCCMGQNIPAWKWAKSDSAVHVSINPSYIKDVVGVRNGKVLWGYLRNRTMTFSVAYGDYAVTEYDTLGNTVAAINIGGRVSLNAIKADTAGNWYVFANVYDTLRLPGGLVYTTNVFANESVYFLFK